MRDGLVRRGVKRIALASFYANLLADRALRRLRGDRPYLLAGDCRRCARCCEAPALRVGRLTFSLPSLRRLFLAWQERVNGWVLVEARESERVFVFRCAHFDTATRLCDSYDSRPGACRDYPRLLLYQPRPELLPGCGYRPLARNAAALRAALAARDLPAEAHAKLERELFLVP